MKLRIGCQVVVMIVILLNPWPGTRAGDSTRSLEAGDTLAPPPPAPPFENASRLAEMGKLEESQRLVASGLAAEPTSIRWHLLKADLLARQGRPAALRETLQTAYALAPNNVDVLSRLAHFRDIYGKEAASTYEELAQCLEGQSGSKQQVAQVLERALVTALRDGNTEVAYRVGPRLRSLGLVDMLPTPAARPESPSSTLSVLGGIRALASVAGMQGGSATERFVSQYAERVVRITSGNYQTTRQFVLDLRDYFQILSRLQAMAGAEGAGSFELSINPNDTQSTEVLRQLGWRLKQHNGKFMLEIGERPADARRQVFASALGIDHAAMKNQLESGRRFQLVIRSEQVPLVMNETFWREEVFKNAPKRPLLQAFLDQPAAARLYIALNSMTQETRGQVLHAADAGTLLNRYSDLLCAFGSALWVQGGEVKVPGGASAQPLWEGLANASPHQPPQFIAALLSADEGKLLAYYHQMACLPAAKQQFMTQSSDRFRAFYRAFPSASRKLKVHNFYQYDGHFEDLLRELPLDRDGHIEWPGGLQAWTGSTGCSTLRAVKPTTKQPIHLKEEDELLLKLLDSNHRQQDQSCLQPEMFLALVRLDRHRHQPMDQSLAVLLRGNYASYQELFPYLASLPDLAAPQVALLFEAANQLESLSGSMLNVGLGEFHSLLQWLILLNGNGAIQDEAVVRLFAALCQGFVNAKSNADLAAHSCEMVRLIATTSQETLRRRASAGDLSLPPRMASRIASGPLVTPDVEEALIQSLAGVPHEIELAAGDRKLRFNYSVWRKQQMQKVLELQCVPSLNALLAIYETLKLLGRGEKATPQALDRTKVLLSDLQRLDRSARQLLGDNQHRILSAARKDDLLSTFDSVLNAKDSQATRRFTTELTGLLNPHVQVALLGWVYAYYFSPHDLIATGDPCFVRKHQFFEERPKRFTWPAMTVHVGESSVSSMGGYLSGGLAQIATAAGELGLRGNEVEESVVNDAASARMSALQLASLRAMPWAALDEHGPRVLAIKLLLGRELLVKAALNPQLLAELAEPLRDLIGLRRWTKVLLALSNHDFHTAFNLTSSSDLYFLIDSYLLRHPEGTWKETPLGQALQNETQRTHSDQASLLGGFQVHSDGCVRPHLVHLGPYEAKEGFIREDRMAERLSSIAFDMAVAADQLGLPVQVLSLLSQKAVCQIAQKTSMTDRDDWEGALEGIRSLQLESLLDSLESQH
jgi:hypothetical protein